LALALVGRIGVLLRGRSGETHHPANAFAAFGQLSGVKRKWLADREDDAIDPLQTFVGAKASSPQAQLRGKDVVRYQW